MSKMFPGSMSSRQRKVAEQIQRALAEHFASDGFYQPELKGAFITISLVHVSVDLRNVKVFINILNVEDQQAANNMLNEMAAELRYEITSKLNLRYSPELRFMLDTVPAEVRYISTFSAAEEGETV